MTGMYKELLPKYDLVHDFVAKYQPRSLVDWGCANGNLLNRVSADFPSIQELGGYDPGILIMMLCLLAPMIVWSVVM